MAESRTELIFHPIRMRILQVLLHGAPMTAGQLGEALEDVPPATLYRHINRLTAGGVISVVEERPVRGVVERVYAVDTRGGASLSGEELARTGPEEQVRYFAVFLAGLLREYERYVQTPAADLATDRVGYRQFPMYLTDEECDALVAGMNELIGSAMRNAPGPGRRRRLLTRILMPADGSGPESADPDLPGSSS